MHAANQQQSQRRGADNIQTCNEFMLHELQLSQEPWLVSERRRGRGVGVLPVRRHWEENDCKLILDQNLERGSVIIFGALQKREAVNCEQSGVSQTSTVNIEVVFILCKSGNNYKLLENLATKLCSYQSLVT